MGNIRKRYPPSFKAKVAMEAIKEDRTTSELANAYKVHPDQIRRWKKAAQSGLTEVFNNKRNKEAKDQEELIQELYKQIGQLKVELDWLKKKSGLIP